MDANMERLRILLDDYTSWVYNQYIESEVNLLGRVYWIC